MSKTSSPREINQKKPNYTLLPSEAKLIQEHRCESCNKLLGVDNFVIPSFDIKCLRCGTVNSVLKDLERQIIITDHTGKIIFINDHVEKVTGYSAEEILGSNPSLWGKQMSTEFYERMWNSILKGKKAIAVEIQNKSKNGKPYKVMLRISPILNIEGEVEFFLGIETVIRDGNHEVLNLRKEKHS